MKTRILSFLLVVTALIFGCKTETPKEEPVALQTYCNPLDLSYRFCLDEPSRREAADPTITVFKGKYYLFASKSGGYWVSDDMTGWDFILTNEIPTEEYAPTAIGIGDTLYFLASSEEKSTIYKSTDPLSGKWEVAVEELEWPVWDPAFFMDDDEKLYLYWGCSNINPLYGIEVDYKNNFAMIGERLELLHSNAAEYGWEVPGDYNRKVDVRPWIEGAWMNKYNGKYYLQYSGPGTEYKSYSDGVYVADSPLGPFTLQEHNPFAHRPDGFAASAGHGSTYADAYGNNWHIGTMTISVKHMFERRLGIFPTFVDETGTLAAITKYGDYPLIVPNKKINGFDDVFAGWMLLSYNKPVQVSSYIDSLPAANMTDEDIRTYWAANSGDAGEYAILDLGDIYDVYAIQMNFAEHGTSIFGRVDSIYHKYTIECSDDNSSWTMLVDKSGNMNDNSHSYTQLPEKVTCQYLKFTNHQVPSGHVALSGFRVFGKGAGEAPAAIQALKAERNADDRRVVQLSWDKVEGASGYNISFGTDSANLYLDYMVYSDTEVAINSLNATKKYYFTIEAFNENGITKSGVVAEVE